MRSFIFIALVACGGSKPRADEPSPGSGEPPGVVTDTRPPIVKRRDAACEKLRPRLVACAVEDAKANLDAGKIKKEQFDKDTAPAIREKLGDKWMEGCQVEMSSRQVRVLEVCEREEPECGPLLSCLEHLNAQAN